MTSWFDVVTVVVQPAGGSTPAAAKHAVEVMVELVAPAEVRVLVIVMLQDASRPAPVGNAGGLHWLAAGAGAVAADAGVSTTPPRMSAAHAVPTINTATRQRRTVSMLNPPINVVMRIAPPSKIPHGHPAELPELALSGCSAGEAGMTGLSGA